jgi:hypothetical protein
MKEMFCDATRSIGDLAGVFEYDGTTGYFYLYQLVPSNKVLRAIHVLSGEPDFTEEDVRIVWDSQETRVGLFIRGTLWGVFDSVTPKDFGGNYKAGTAPRLPAEFRDLEWLK